MSIFIHRNLDIFGTMIDQISVPFVCLRGTEYSQNENKIKIFFYFHKY